MRPARPYHVNHPPRRANGSVAESERFYEVVGHRDGPVVARFYFTDGPETETEAASSAEALANGAIAKADP